MVIVERNAQSPSYLDRTQTDPNIMPVSMSDSLVTVLLPSKDPFGSSSVQGFES